MVCSHLERSFFYFVSDYDYENDSTMSTKKEMIENLKIEIGGLQDSVNLDKFQRVEDTLNELSTALLRIRTGPVAIRVISLATVQR